MDMGGTGTIRGAERDRSNVGKWDYRGHAPSNHFREEKNMLGLSVRLCFLLINLKQYV